MIHGTFSELIKGAERINWPPRRSQILLLKRGIIAPLSEFLWGHLSMGFVTRVKPSLGCERVMMEISLSVRFNVRLTTNLTETIEISQSRRTPARVTQHLSSPRSSARWPVPPRGFSLLTGGQTLRYSPRQEKRAQDRSDRNCLFGDWLVQSAARLWIFALIGRHSRVDVPDFQDSASSEYRSHPPSRRIHLPDTSRCQVFVYRSYRSGEL